MDARDRRDCGRDAGHSPVGLLRWPWPVVGTQEKKNFLLDDNGRRHDVTDGAPRTRTRKVSRALDSVTDTRPLDSRRREPRKVGVRRRTDSRRGRDRRKKKKGQKTGVRVRGPPCCRAVADACPDVRFGAGGLARSGWAGWGGRAGGPRAASPIAFGLGEPSGYGRPVGLLRWVGEQTAKNSASPE
jgi:hypothetical protein